MKRVIRTRKANRRAAGPAELAPPSEASFAKVLSKALRSGGAAMAAAAGGEDDPAAIAREALDALRSKRARMVLLKPRGPRFYEDPVLESAWQLMQAAREARVSAAAQGEDLDDSFYHWIPHVIPIILGRFKHTREVLAPRVPNPDRDGSSLCRPVSRSSAMRGIAASPKGACSR